MNTYKSHLVSATTIKDIRLPFMGLYNSYLGDELDIELEQCTQDMADDKATAVYDFIQSLDLTEYHQALTNDYAKFLINSINSEHGLNIVISGIEYVPMNGQNRGDTLHANVDVSTLPQIELNELQPYATESLTSYSGFISFYSPDLTPLQGAKLENWNDVYISYIIEYLVNDCDDMDYAYIDYLRSNGGAIEMLMNNISAEQCEQLNKLL